MSKSQFKRLIIQKRCLPKEHTGLTNDLKGAATTMWTERHIKCPNNGKHTISRSSRRWYCYDCGIYWDDFQKAD